MRQFIKRLLLSLVALLVFSMAAGALYFYVNPIANPKMLLSMAVGQNNSNAKPETIIKQLKVPTGFTISLYARGLPMARMLHVTAAGDLLVSRPRAGEIVLLERDRNGDGFSDGRRVLLSGLNRPHGVDVAHGWLYVGETDAIGRVQFDEETGKLGGTYQRIVTGLSGEGNHWTKTVRVGPDDYLYVAQGSTCNVCEEKDKRRATIMRFNLDGSGGVIYASGLRNSVGMDWAPWDNQLYATDNGRDLLGDDFPPCELNRIVKGGFYGWPYINGFGVLDPDFGKDKSALLKTAISPAHGFRAHNAPLGIHFLRDTKFPGFERSALVALHGSWNRSEPDGYKVVQLQWRADGSIDERDFLTGFERDGKVIGRPVDVAEDDAGAVYVSDDYAGAIYRITYGTNVASSVAAATTDERNAPETAVDSELMALSAAERASLSEQGSALFRQYRCGQCHDPKYATELRRIRPLQQLSARYSMRQLQDFLRAPQPPMPVFPLSDDERKALAAHLLTRN